MQFFHEDEFRCQHCGSLSGVDWEFASEIDELRKRVGFPLSLSSAYRCADHPIEKRKKKPGSHSTGRAVDVAVTGAQALKVIETALEMGFERVGVNQKGSGRFIHLDKAHGFSAPAIWSY
ncbi:MAG: D-Ala-D-Ala carboxypeptidase family metallohydrolase [Alphaproteobacteria bacterium]